MTSRREAQVDESRVHLRPRVSLLGRPIILGCRAGVTRVSGVGGGGSGGGRGGKGGAGGGGGMSQRKDIRYRRLQTTVYNFLERPKNWKAICYQLIVFLMVFMCLLLSIFSTVEQYEEIAGSILFYLEVLMVVWFVIEFVVRVWSAGCRSRYQQLTGRLQFVRRPLCVLDVVVTSASIVILCFGSSGKVFATSALRGLRFFQILRMLRVDRRGGSWKLLGSVIWAHRQELFTTLYIGFLGLIFFSFMMFLVEKDRNPGKFGTYPDALWWGVITLCTIGYGDAVPITWPGKLIACCCAILGITFFALPAGIMGSGFALKVQQQQRQKHLIRRKAPAAVLIQCLWRCYAADEHSASVATWKIHTKPCKTLLTRSSSQKYRPNSSFMSRLSIRRKDVFHNNSSSSSTAPPVTGSPGQTRRNMIHRTHSHNMPRVSEVSLVNDKRNHASLSDISQTQSNSSSTKKQNQLTLASRETEIDYKAGDDSDENNEGVVNLTNVHKRAIRAIRKIKFFVARRVFKEALKPYDVKDVIEQYSAGHLDMLARVKDLQSRLDLIVGQTGSKKGDTHESKVCLASRLIKIERQIHGVESKVDALLDMYKEDRTTSLTDRHHHQRRHHSPPHSMHLLPDRPPPTTGSTLLQPPPPPPPSSPAPTTTPCPSFQILPHPQNGHRVAAKQLSEPNPPRLHPDQGVRRLTDPENRLVPGRCPAQRSLSYTTNMESRGPAAATLAPPVDGRVNDARNSVAQRVFEDRGGLGVVGVGIGVVSEGLAKYHIHCPEIAQRLQKASTFSTDSRQSFTSESLASEDDSGSAPLDCFPAPESCAV